MQDDNNSAYEKNLKIFSIRIIRKHNHRFHMIILGEDNEENV